VLTCSQPYSAWHPLWVGEQLFQLHVTVIALMCNVRSCSYSLGTDFTFLPSNALRSVRAATIDHNELNSTQLNWSCRSTVKTSLCGAIVTSIACSCSTSSHTPGALAIAGFLVSIAVSAAAVIHSFICLKSTNDKTHHYCYNTDTLWRLIIHVHAARVRNSLSDLLVTSAPSVAVFRSRLKARMFNISFPCDVQWL